MLSKVHCNALVDNCIQNSHLGKYIIIPTGYMVETLVYTWQLSQQCKTTTMTNHKQCSSRLHFQHFIAEYTVPNSRCSPILHCRLKFASARPCVPKKTLLKLFFFNFTNDNIPDPPRADSDDFTSTIHVYKCKNRDGNDVIRSFLLSTPFKNILERQHPC